MPASEALKRARRGYVLALWRLHTEAEQNDEIVFLLHDLAIQSSVGPAERHLWVSDRLGNIIDALGAIIAKAAEGRDAVARLQERRGARS